MTFYEVASSPLLAGLVIAGVIAVIIMCFLTGRKAWTRSLELGIPGDQLVAVVRSSIIFSILPSIAIVIGLFALVTFLEKSWAFFRLSVIGSVMYEAFVASGVLSSKGWSAVPVEASGTVFVEIMFVMSLAILSGPLFSFFAAKGIQSKTLKAGTGDKRWATVLNNCYFVSILLVFITQYIFKALILPNRAGWPAFLTMITGLLCAKVLSTIMKRTGQKWMGDFVMPVSLVLAMGSSVIWTNMFLA